MASRNEENKKKLASITCLGLIAIFPIAIVLNGIVLKILWHWFVVETFHIAELSIPAAMGIVLVMRYLTDSGIRIKSEYLDNDMWWLTAITSPLLTFSFGFVIHLFMHNPYAQ